MKVEVSIIYDTDGEVESFRLVIEKGEVQIVLLVGPGDEVDLSEISI